jgi:hypothetical protein
VSAEPSFPQVLAPQAQLRGEARELAQRLKLERLTAAQHNEARVFALRVVRDPLYREKLLIFARARRLHPLIEQMLWHYAYGKPPDRIELGRIGDSAQLETLSKEELAQRARDLADMLLKPATDTSDQAQAAAAAQTDGVIEDRLAAASELLQADEASKAAKIAAVEAKKAQALAARQGKPLTPKAIGELLEAEGLLDEDLS